MFPWNMVIFHSYLKVYLGLLVDGAWPTSLQSPAVDVPLKCWFFVRRVPLATFDDPRGGQKWWFMFGIFIGDGLILTAHAWQTLSGWWFGTCLIFHILGIIIPIDYSFSEELKPPASCIYRVRCMYMYIHIHIYMICD